MNRSGRGGAVREENTRHGQPIGCNRGAKILVNVAYRSICVYCANRQEKGLHLVFSSRHHACVDVLRFIDISIMVCVCAVQYKCMRNILFLFFLSRRSLLRTRARLSLSLSRCRFPPLSLRSNNALLLLDFFFPTYFCPLFSFMCLCTTM